MTPQQMQEVYYAGLLKRHHTNPSDAVQTIGHHSWGVAMLLEYIYPQCSKAALLAALAHDVGERWCGDTPGPVKWANARLSACLDIIETDALTALGLDYDLSGEEFKALKVADLLELLMFCNYRLTMGDNFFLQVRENVYNWFRNNWTAVKDFPLAETLFHDATRHNAHPV